MKYKTIGAFKNVQNVPYCKAAEDMNVGMGVMLDRAALTASLPADGDEAKAAYHIVTNIGDKPERSYMGNKNDVLAGEYVRADDLRSVIGLEAEFSAAEVATDLSTLAANDMLAFGAGGKLYVTNERFPAHIHEVRGFPPASGPAVVPISVKSDEPRDRRLFVSDLAGLDFVHGSGHLLALSEASKLVIELDEAGRPISSLSLLWGHGMDGWAPQPEGVATDDQGTLYLVSEPNLFYVFKRQED